MGQAEDGREGCDGCPVPRWLDGETQRQTWFSDSVVSAVCHQALHRNPVNTLQIQLTNTHRAQVEAVATRRRRVQEASRGVAISEITRATKHSQNARTR